MHVSSFNICKMTNIYHGPHGYTFCIKNYRSTVESPMSPTSFGSEPFPKKPRLGIAGGKSLLEIWTTRIEKENAKKHVPFAGERSLGEKAKLYLSLERKDNDGNNDRPGATGAEM